MNMTNKRTNWRVRVYNSSDHVIATWDIFNRTEHEAVGEAIADVNNTTGYYDWTMTEIDLGHRVDGI